MTDPTSPIREAIEVARRAKEHYEILGRLCSCSLCDTFRETAGAPETVTALLEAVEAAKPIIEQYAGIEEGSPEANLVAAVEEVEALLSSKGGRG